MTSRELTSGFDFCGHLRIAMAHIYTKFGAKTYIQTEVRLLTFFSKLDFYVMWIWHIPQCWQFGAIPNLVQIYIIVTEIGALMLQTSFDDVTRINFRFRVLIMGVICALPWRICLTNLVQISLSNWELLTFFPNPRWSSTHGGDASSHQI